MNHLKRLKRPIEIQASWLRRPDDNAELSIPSVAATAGTSTARVVVALESDDDDEELEEGELREQPEPVPAVSYFNFFPGKPTS